MYQDVVSFRRDTHKPVVACMMDVAASGAYYIAMGCDRVYAHPTTVTGSIGVIMSLYNASGLFTKLGVTTDPIKSGPNKDIGNPGRPMTDEERAILQGIVDGFYGQFVHVVAQGRQLPEDQVRKLADGRVYTGMEARKAGLVDEIGYLDEELLLVGAELPWHTGPPGLEKGPGICHGTAGNGYAFLKAFERTGDEQWLRRARRFAIHALEQAERLRAQRGRGRYSLWTGDVGVAVYAADCLDGRSDYPIFESV